MHQASSPVHSCHVGGRAALYRVEKHLERSLVLFLGRINPALLGVITWLLLWLRRGFHASTVK